MLLPLLLALDRCPGLGLLNWLLSSLIEGSTSHLQFRYKYYSSSKCPCPNTYAARIHFLISAQWYTKARSWLKDLIRNLETSCSNSQNACQLLYTALAQVEGHRFCPEVFNVLIIALCELDMVEQALWVYHETETLPSLHACHALLSGTVKSGRFTSCWDQYGGMLSRGLSPDFVIYSILISACFKQADIVNAKRFREEMTSKGVEPTVTTYTSLIRGQFHVNQVVEAEYLFRKMKESGRSPDLRTCTVIIYVDASCWIDYHVKQWDTKQALRLFSEMQEAGVTPNAMTLHCFINGLCKDGRTTLSDSSWRIQEPVVGTLMWTRRWVEHSVLQTQVIYSTLIRGLCRSERLVKATKFYTNMRSSGLILQVEAYFVLLDGHLRAC